MQHHLIPRSTHHTYDQFCLIFLLQVCAQVSTSTVSASANTIRSKHEIVKHLSFDSKHGNAMNYARFRRLTGRRIRLAADLGGCASPKARVGAADGGGSGGGLAGAAFVGAERNA
jgi:hypothetical protein